MRKLCCVTFYLFCEFTSYTVVDTALSLTLTWVCWQLALVSVQHCFHQATSIDPLKSGPRIEVTVDLDPLSILWGQLRL